MFSNLEKLAPTLVEHFSSTHLVRARTSSAAVIHSSDASTEQSLSAAASHQRANALHKAVVLPARCLDTQSWKLFSAVSHALSTVFSQLLFKPSMTSCICGPIMTSSTANSQNLFNFSLQYAPSNALLND